MTRLVKASTISKHNKKVLSSNGGNIRVHGYNYRSSQNGAGNHRDTEETKRLKAEHNAAKKVLVDIALAPYIAVQKESQRVKRKLPALFRRMAAWGSSFVEEHVIEDITQLSVWNTKRVKVRCKCGRLYHATPDYLMTTRAKYGGCVACAADARRGGGSTNNKDARIKYSMRMDEQGRDITKFTTMASPAEVTDRATELSVTMYPKNAQRWQFVEGNGGWVRRTTKAHIDRRVKFVADPDDHVFFFIGPTPTVIHPFIADLLGTQPVEIYNELTGSRGLGVGIKECLDAGDKVVNMSQNESWLGDDKYSWGKLPDLKAYIKYNKDLWKEK